MDNDDSQQVRPIQITYWQADGVNRLLAASSHTFVGLMQDGRTVLKYPVQKTLDDSYSSSTANEENCSM
jgi:hypothetical protein